MKPEEIAREKIDLMLHESGWYICDRKSFNTEYNAVALREALMKGGREADYLLFIDNKAVGVLEAKSESNMLGDEVSFQAERYCKTPLNWYQVYEKPLPLVYISNGNKILFRDLRDKDGKYQEIKKIHTPKNIVDILGITAEYAGMPLLDRGILRQCQYDAINNLEKSFKNGDKKALIVLATGAGKTFTACMFTYRFLKYTNTKRILFLVDRRNLGNQAESEYTSFIMPDGKRFSDFYLVQNLSDNKINDSANVVITTIQKLYSVLTGRDIEEDDDLESIEEENFDNSRIDIGNNLHLSSDYFDYIIIDECHRSIYGRWRAVLDYFKTARFIGLTATPIPDTIAFFNNNVVEEYTLSNSIADGINVPKMVYTISTRMTEEGTVIKDGEEVIVHENYTNKNSKIKNKKDKIYGRNQLNRAVFEESQIRLVINEYKKIVYKELYPYREANYAFLPKTLIFAANDRHADFIVSIIKDIFKEQSDDFVKKITYSAGDSDNLIREFRNNKNFRIAVTVNLVATGTDIKPLEVIIFMRDVSSETFYMQMKGRGVRSISLDELRNATPNADSKDVYYLIDAAGVETSMKVINMANDNSDFNITLERLLEEITHGNLPNDYLEKLGNKISRINAKADDEQRDEFMVISGYTMNDIANKLLSAVAEGKLPPYLSINDENRQRKELVYPLSSNPDAREYLLKLNKGFITYANTNEDTLLYAGFSVEDAKEDVTAFEKFINDNKDKIEALRLIYNGLVEQLSYDKLSELVKILHKESERYTVKNMWNSYKILEPKNVLSLTRKEEIDIITNIISLIRFAYKHDKFLKPLSQNFNKYFSLWIGHIKQNYGELNEEQKELAKNISEYIIKNGALSEEVLKQDRSNLEMYRLIKQQFGTDKINTVLVTLSKYLLAS